MEKTLRVCDFCGMDRGSGGPEVVSGTIGVLADGKRISLVVADEAGNPLDMHAGCVLSWFVAQLMDRGSLYPAWLAEYITGIPAGPIRADIIVTPEALRVIGVKGPAQRFTAPLTGDPAGCECKIEDEAEKR